MQEKQRKSGELITQLIRSKGAARPSIGERV